MSHCLRPYMQGNLPFGCGKCMPCKIKRRRLWAFRLVLESYMHVGSCFVTLTYRPEEVPNGSSLVPLHVQLWLKRFRKCVSPQRVRYFAVGEYGEKTERPHYHVAIFGVGPADVLHSGQTVSEVVASSWGKGFVSVGELTSASASYVVGYVLKKMTSKSDVRLYGRLPEFSRMSLKPGIGAEAMKLLGTRIMESDFALNEVSLRKGDVPSVLRLEGKISPLGRYLKGRLRHELGLPKGTPKETLEKWSYELFLSRSKEIQEVISKGKSGKDIYKYLLDKVVQKSKSIEGKQKIFDSRRSL